MSNNVASTPYSFTAKMAASFHNTGGSSPASGPLTISSVVWVSPTAAGHEATITDGVGKTLAHWVASAEDVANGQVSIPLLVLNHTVKDFQVISLSSGTLYINTSAVTPTSAGINGGTVTTKGTAIAAGTAQAQTALSIPGVTANSAISYSLGSLPASWQTGIEVEFVVTNDTITPYLVNPTSGSITPVAIILNIRVVN